MGFKVSAFHFLVAITALHLMFFVKKGTVRHSEAVQKDLKSLTDLHIATVVKSMHNTTSKWKIC